ncbi:MAG: hypothetical protein LBM93_13810 [Oscillospiraceae bacterium]|jgi:hypothetical protein|nr:hypothetical protein [Oscillospiraceae bacterium]
MPTLAFGALFVTFYFWICYRMSRKRIEDGRGKVFDSFCKGLFFLCGGFIHELILGQIIDYITESRKFYQLRDAQFAQNDNGCKYGYGKCNKTNGVCYNCSVFEAKMF